MDITIHPAMLRGSVAAIPSKSQAHRLLICAAFADRETVLDCPQTNRDIEATAECLRSLGADIRRTDKGYTVIPIKKLPETAVLRCGESGSTLRFMLPIVGALGVDATFIMEARLPQRPLSPLWEEMERMGCRLTRPTADTLRCQGQLQGGEYAISGNVSSQFITGLLFAAALLRDSSRIRVLGRLESKPYVDMTLEALSLFGVQTRELSVQGGQVFRSPGHVNVEGDWSNGAFFLAAKALGSDVTVTNLSSGSPQGDRAAADWLERLPNGHCVIDATDIPDLVPILAVVAGASHGAVFSGIHRLRLKETDRVATVCAMLNALGAEAVATKDTLSVSPAPYQSCRINATNDHRIAMSAGIAATVAAGPVTIIHADSVNKSYPDFWAEYRRLGGNYEQHLR
jgi:3-phosphoshikimate 1-carboxyvinyltransferase